MDIEKTKHMSSDDFDNNFEKNEDLGEIKIKVQNIEDVNVPEYRDLDPEEMDYYRGLLEAILFLANEPLSVSILARQIQLDKTNTRILLDSLMDEYLERNSGIILKEIAGGYRFVTSEKYADELKKIFKPKSNEKLSRSVLETLAIICYKQPITLPEIEEIRGVNSRAMVSTLLQKNLIKPQGYKQVPGRPTLYVTTKEFLIKFNLSSLADLPPLKDLKELPLDNLENIEE
jgi:segregation and condensation protein B